MYREHSKDELTTRLMINVTYIKSLWGNTCSLSGLVAVDVHIGFKNPMLDSPSAWKYSNCIRQLVITDLMPEHSNTRILLKYYTSVISRTNRASYLLLTYYTGMIKGMIWFYLIQSSIIYKIWLFIKKLIDYRSCQQIF